MRTLTQPELAWELHRAGARLQVIAQRVERHRATVYRWLKGIRLGGLREFVEDYKGAKKRPRRRKVNPYIEQRVLSIRGNYRDCCGEKILYWLKKEGTHLSRSTVYRILNKYLHLRPKGEQEPCER